MTNIKIKQKFKDIILYISFFMMFYIFLKIIPYLSMLNKVIFISEVEEILGSKYEIQDVLFWADYYYQLLQWIDIGSTLILLLSFIVTLIYQKKHNNLVLMIRRAIVIIWLILLSMLLYNTIKPIYWSLYANSLFINFIVCLFVSIDFGKFIEKSLISYRLSRTKSDKHLKLDKEKSQNKDNI